MSRQILVVDDNQVNTKLVSCVLVVEGYQVACAAEAQQAISMLQKKTFDLILMDLALPGMDGLELTRRLKLDVQTKKIPVVALTANAMKGDEQQALDAGCIGYITKPINTSEFPKQIENFLENSDGK